MEGSGREKDGKRGREGEDGKRGSGREGGWKGERGGDLQLYTFFIKYFVPCRKDLIVFPKKLDAKKRLAYFIVNARCSS